ncbi:hypothetical protein MMC28_004400 [Mycoblastus sanguinarius]|nr:hypothetical protein [Mycoblastus sanguinarius]
MAADAVTESNGPKYTEQQLIAEYLKIIKLRDDVFAGVHPTLKLPKQQVGVGKALSNPDLSPSVALSSSQLPNGVHKPSPVNTVPAQVANPHIPTPQPNPSLSKSPNNQKMPTPALGSSGIDPIFLTKSDVLVRAEIHQKRQRIERTLEEQIHQKRVITRQKISDQESLPDFDVTDVLRRAQELVKPIKLHENIRANGAASSSDSFDERTFYSSQMNESTTTEEADESHKWRPHRICRFFLQGEHCRYGDACTFSHDPALKQRLEADGSQAMDLDSVNADEQTSSRSDDIPKPVSTNETRPHPPTKGTSATDLRVAELEEQLRIAKSQLQGLSDAPAHSQVKDSHESQEGSAYSPPGPDEFERDVELRQVEARQPATSTTMGHSSANGLPPAREYARRNENAHSPLPSNVRVVRNHITSPVAPQPARVSPLAVAKVPQISQLQRNHGESRRPSRMSNAGDVSAGQSPKVAVQPLSSRKRRRGRDSGEHTRNVVPRRDLASPEIRIKEEPVSPLSFNNGSEIRRIRPRQEGPRQLYVDTGAPQYRDQEPVFYQPRALDRPPQGFMSDDRRPLTPLARRVVSRNGQKFIANEEQDLRRVVSARQVRAPLSPAPYPVQYSAPQPRSVRAASQVYISPTGQGVPQQYKASVQPQPATYMPPDGSPSPPMRRVQYSPVGRDSIAMAPPPRHIVIDQYGNKFMEAPIPAERQVSVAPVIRRSELDPGYGQSAPRSSSVRQSQLVSVDDEGHYIRRVPSPASSGSFQYPQPNRTRQVIDQRGDVYDGDPYVMRTDGARVMEYPEARPVGRYEEVVGPREGMMRMQSARPVERQYEVPREQITRVQSVRPQQPRIVNLGERQEVSRPQVSSQVSVLEDHGSVRQVNYAVEERPRYQYADQVQGRGGYVEETQGDGGLYEVPGSMGGRTIQRL